MKIFTVLFLTVSLATLVFSENAEKYSRIKVFITDREFLNEVWKSGIDFEGASGKPGGWMEFVAGPREKNNLSDAGIKYEIVIDDLSAYDAARLTQGKVNAMGFGYGSMGGYYTYAEIGLQLDSMRLLYPSLISLRSSIGITHEGREMWMVKISDNVESSEPEEPEILYTALHHAREPEGMMTVMYYMWWLLENYGTNAEASYLVNNRQMYFIPVVNPDGYVHNQTTNPNGGGYWRENRRPNGGACYGVDLNRNYGPYEMWNASNGGSSVSQTCGQGTYRGPSYFSEPETRAIDTLMRTHNFRTAFNYHTYGNYLIYPYGYLSRENEDSLIYRDWTYEMQEDNHYTNGTDQQTVNYSTRGNSDDYMYGDVSGGKPVTYTMTPEVGTTGFWPSTGEIFPLAQANLKQNKVLAYVGGSYPRMTSYSIQDDNFDGFLERGEQFTLTLNIKNRGLKATENLTVDVVSLNPDVQFSNNPFFISTIDPQTISLAELTGSVNNNAITGVPTKFFITLTDADGFIKYDSISINLGAPTTLLADSASAGTGNWTTGSSWGTIADAHTPPFAFTDSPAGKYGPNANNSLTTVNQIDLTSYQYAQLKFWTKWIVEPSWDFATVEISSNGGSTWTSLRTELSHSGSNRSAAQPSNAWGYENYTPGLTWVEQSADISSYIGNQIKIRFRLASDGGDHRDGFYVDDIRLYGWNENYDTTAPNPTTLVSPPDDTLNVTQEPTLTWNSIPNAIWYRLQVAEDSMFSSIVFDDSTLTDTVNFLSTLSYETVYFWRVSPRNHVGSSAFTEAWSFTTIIAPPVSPLLTYPTDNQTHIPLDITLVWSASPSSDNYILQVSTDSLFSLLTVDDSTITDTSYSLTGLTLQTKYYWRVKAVNSGGSSAFSPASFSTVGLPPTSPVLVLPPDSAMFLPSTLVIEWEETAGTEHYHVQVASDSLFSNLVFEDSALTLESVIITGLENETEYFWRTRADNEFGPGDWSPVWRFTTGVYTIGLSLNSRWNLVSVPVIVQNYAKGMVFPSASSSAFSFEGGYVANDTLVSGAGYWLKFSSAHTVNLVGPVITSQSVQVVDDWNLIGSLTYPISTSSITSNPGGMITSQFYGFDGSYVTSDSIKPGKAYWVKVNGNGELLLSSVVSQLSLADKITIVPISELPPPSPEGDGNVISVPKEFSLEQNYPNPFNPTTVIQYSVPVGESPVQVNLTIYNMLGVEVAMLVDEFQASGFKTVNFDASNLPSGIYTYRLNVGGLIAVKKMVLMR